MGGGGRGGDQEEARGGTGTCGGGRQSKPRQLPWVRCPQLGRGAALDKAPVQLRRGWLWPMPPGPASQPALRPLSVDQNVQTPVPRLWPRPPRLPMVCDHRRGLSHPHSSWRPPARGQPCGDTRDRLTCRTQAGTSKSVNFPSGSVLEKGNAGVPRSLGVWPGVPPRKHVGCLGFVLRPWWSQQKQNRTFF